MKSIYERILHEQAKNRLEVYWAVILIILCIPQVLMSEHTWGFVAAMVAWWAWFVFGEKLLHSVFLREAS